MKARCLAYFQEHRKGTAVAAILVTALLIPQSSKAIFGFGDIVFDPSSWASLGEIWSSNVSNGLKLEETFQQAQKIYKNGVDVYTLGRAMSQHFTDKQRWLNASGAVVGMYLPGSNGALRDILNGDYRGAAQDGVGAWARASSPMGDTSYLAQELPGLSRRAAAVSTVQLAQATAVRCNAAIAAYQDLEQRNQAGINALSVLQMSDDPLTNSEVEQLNLENAALHQQLMEMKTQGTLQTCLAQSQTIANKMEADKIAGQVLFEGDVARARGVNADTLSPDDTYNALQNRFTGEGQSQ